MYRTLMPSVGIALGAMLVSGTPSLAHGAAAGIQQSRPESQDTPKTTGTKGSVAAGDVKDVAEKTADKTEDALEKAGRAIGDAAEATKDAVVAGAKKTKDVVLDSPEKIDETWITAKIAGKINADDALEHVDVDVKVKKNVVTITGDVPSVALRDRILRIARETDGVVKVIDRMTLRAVTQ